MEEGVEDSEEKDLGVVLVAVEMGFPESAFTGKGDLILEDLMMMQGQVDQAAMTTAETLVGHHMVAVIPDLQMIGKLILT